MKHTVRCYISDCEKQFAGYFNLNLSTNALVPRHKTINMNDIKAFKATSNLESVKSFTATGLRPNTESLLFSATMLGSTIPCIYPDSGNDEQSCKLKTIKSIWLLK